MDDTRKIKDYIIHYRNEKGEREKINCGGIKPLSFLADLKPLQRNSGFKTGNKLLVIQSEDCIEFYLIDKFFTQKNLADFLKAKEYSDMINFDFMIISEFERFPSPLLP